MATRERLCELERGEEEPPGKARRRRSRLIVFRILFTLASRLEINSSKAKHKLLQNLMPRVSQSFTPLQGDQSGLRQSFVGFDLVVPLPARFCFGSRKSVKIGRHVVEFSDQNRQNEVADLFGHNVIQIL